MDLLTFATIGFAIWTTVVVVAIALCRAAARADRAADVAGHRPNLPAAAATAAPFWLAPTP